MTGAAHAAWAEDPLAAAALLRVGDSAVRVSFRASGAELRPTADALVPMLLMPAMRAREDACVVGGVSPRLSSAVPQIQTLLRSWAPDLFGLVEFELAPASTLVKPTARTACLFSGGLDSFCEVIRRRDEIDDLLYVYGFDVPFSDAPRRRDAARAVRAGAKGLGFPLIEVETDLRSFSDRYLTWEDYHGAALAATALLLQHGHSRVLVASSHVGDDLSAWGSHPLLDPLWSTERLEIVHSGRGLSRVEKAAVIAASETAMANLRVCYLPPPGMINCGRCEKCLRTAVSLAAVGAAGRCQTLPPRIDPEQLAALELDEVSRGYWLDNLVALRRSGEAAPLAAALEIALERSQPPDDWSELERRLHFDREHGEPSARGVAVRALRRSLLRLLGPYTFHQRRLDEQLVAELRQRLGAERDAQRRLEQRVEQLEHDPRRRG